MTESTTGISRRTLVKGAAWSVPVLALAAATPMAAASTAAATVAWTNAGQILRLSVFNGGQVAGITALMTAPNQLSIQNTTTPIAGPLTIQIVSQYSSGLDLSLLGKPRGVGVRTLSGYTASGWNESEGAVLVSVPVVGTPLLWAPYTITSTFSVPGLAGNAAHTFDVGYMYGQNIDGLLNLSALITFNFTVIVRDASNAIVGGTSVTAPGSFLLNLSVL
ncbi:hypothetical protein JOD62_002035 [Microbacterium keratanolyticum]|uniref:Uncharacterized protein n=1 Tax=Microbacterium keratanolyticum TaxID=67574 RepID=A0A9W6M8T1_9MICO|nr:hypothetical protein [Microbacterium keratanolyticum]MBM7469487.1 hypothetical protein [Microbacterium keratanolyticum]GLK01566.1 hypothetical protein GCM10017596_12810 [Microbacterium keratanolyticum]